MAMLQALIAKFVWIFFCHICQKTQVISEISSSIFDEDDREINYKDCGFESCSVAFILFRGSTLVDCQKKTTHSCQPPLQSALLFLLISFFTNQRLSAILLEYTPLFHHGIQFVFMLSLSSGCVK